MARKHLILIMASVATLAAAAAVAQQVAPAAPAATAPATQDATTFGAGLVTAITDAIAKNPGLTPVALQTVLEDALQAVFVQANVSPDTAKAGVEASKVSLTAKGLYCPASDGPATKTCEAVAKALDLALAATQATGAIGNNGTVPFGAPPNSGSAGGGGGVTHPPVS